MSNCPLTGLPCSDFKNFTISEEINQFTHTTKCCRKCACNYVNLRNNVANNPPISLANIEEVISTLLKEVDNQFLQEVKNKILSNQLIKPSSSINSDIKTCPGCKITWDEIREKGVMGCSQCYETFMEGLLEPLAQMHNTNNVAHVGKIPSKEQPVNSFDVNNVISMNDKIRSMNKNDLEKVIHVMNDKMKDAIESENYELAGELKKFIQQVQELKDLK